MGKPCVVFGCREQSANKSGVNAFLFPKEPSSVRRAWVNFVKTTRTKFSVPTKNNVICARHFTADSFVENTCIRAIKQKVGLRHKTCLRKDAVPTIMKFDTFTAASKVNIDASTETELTRREKSAMLIKSLHDYTLTREKALSTSLWPNCVPTLTSQWDTTWGYHSQPVNQSRSVPAGTDDPVCWVQRDFSSARRVHHQEPAVDLDYKIELNISDDSFDSETMEVDIADDSADFKRELVEVDIAEDTADFKIEFVADDSTDFNKMEPDFSADGIGIGRECAEGPDMQREVCDAVDTPSGKTGRALANHLMVTVKTEVDDSEDTIKGLIVDPNPVKTEVDDSEDIAESLIAGPNPVRNSQEETEETPVELYLYHDDASGCGEIKSGHIVELVGYHDQSLSRPCDWQEVGEYPSSNWKVGEYPYPPCDIASALLAGPLRLPPTFPPVIPAWNSLPVEAVSAPTLEGFICKMREHLG